MTALATIDGETMPLERASVGILDRGFLYGDSVFETLRTYSRAPFLLSRHVDRLERSAELVAIDIGVTRTVLEEEVLRTLRAADNDESYVRITITRGAGRPGLAPSLATGPRRIVLVMPLEQPARTLFDEGIRAVTVRAGRITAESLANGAKLGNYIENVLALRIAVERGAADALILDAEGRIVQGTSSNVFFVKAGELWTPPLETFVLPGVTRGRVLEIAEELGMVVKLVAPSSTELATMDEVFLSSSIRELAPVVEVDGRDIGAGRPGPVHARLLNAYREAAARESPSGRRNSQ